MNSGKGENLAIVQ